MLSVTWTEVNVLIYFLYGLAFYSMGLALLLESGRASELGFARSMRLLAGFGMLHGVHEWIDMIEGAVELHFGIQLPFWALWLRLAILVTSFLALMVFGEHMLTRERDDDRPFWYITAGAALWYAASCVIVSFTYRLDEPGWLAAADVLARYILGIPGSLLACWALLRQRTIFRQRGMGAFVRDLTVAAAALALYGVIGQAFTRESAVFPSTVLNSELFLQLIGFPVQLLRAVTAGVVAIAMMRVLRALEVEYEQRLEQVQSARIKVERLSKEELARLNEELKIANEETARLLREVQRRDAVRGELIQRITAAQEAERQRIARELHDGTGQALTGLALGLRGLAAQVVRDPQAAAGRLSMLETMATASVGELRHLINDLRPPQLDDMGLAAALRWMVDRFKENEKPTVQLTVRGEVRSLPSEVETTLFRIAQEGLTNALKHARADHVQVTLDYDDGPSLTVQDDGVGFDPAAAQDPDALHAAWGLVGMRERATLIHADLELDSKPGAGTRFRIRLNERESLESLYAD